MGGRSRSRRGAALAYGAGLEVQNQHRVRTVHDPDRPLDRPCHSQVRHVRGAGDSRAERAIRVGRGLWLSHRSGHRDEHRDAGRDAAALGRHTGRADAV